MLSALIFYALYALYSLYALYALSDQDKACCARALGQQVRNGKCHVWHSLYTLASRGGTSAFLMVK